MGWPGAHLGPGWGGRLSPPTLVQCSPTWQPRAPRRQRAGFLLLGGPRPPQAQIPSSQVFGPSPPGSDHKKRPFLWRALTSDVRHPRAKPPAKRTSPEHFFRVRGSVAVGHQQHILPLHPPRVLGPPERLPGPLPSLRPESRHLKTLLAHAGGSWPTQSGPGRFPVRAKLSNRVARQCRCTHSNISVKLQKKKK